MVPEHEAERARDGPCLDFAAPIGWLGIRPNRRRCAVATEPTARSRWLSILRWATYGLIAVPILITIIAQAIIPPLVVFLVLFVAGLVWLGRDERKGTIMLGVLALLFFALN